MWEGSGIGVRFLRAETPIVFLCSFFRNSTWRSSNKLLPLNLFVGFETLKRSQRRDFVYGFLSFFLSALI